MIADAATSRLEADNPSGRATRPPAWPYVLLSFLWAGGAVLVVWQAVERHQAVAGGRSLSDLLAAVVIGVVAVAMAVGLFFLLSTFLKSAWYVLARRRSGAAATGRARPCAVLYLTAGDFDPEAVRSLLRLRSDGPLLFVLHDDGDDEAARERMAAFVNRHADPDRWEVRILHRPDRSGAKPGAVNWVLERLEDEWELLLLCDSDSIAIDPDSLTKAFAEFERDDAAIVQFRCASHGDASEPEFHRRLAQAIDVFDVLASAQSRWGYVPFMGHNALLRLRDVKEAGGLTPGFFSDDLDLSARMTLRGKRIVYRGDIAFAERHPPDVTAFRKRSRKWAYGCTQVVRTRLLDVVRTPRIPLAHRIGLIEFMGFYPATLLLVVGLLLAFLVQPWLAPLHGFGGVLCGAVGAGVLLALMAPTLAWCICNARLRDWPLLCLSCILVYGGSILPSARGVLDGLSLKERPWIPTNLKEKRAAVPRAALAEALLGLALLGVPWYFGGPELAFPSTYLFIGVFLLSPLTFATYRHPDDLRAERDAVQTQRRLRLSWRAAAAALGLAAVAGVARAAEPAVTTSGDSMLIDGKPLEVRGVHYSPWEPGTGPATPEKYPERRVVVEDLSRIADLGASAILTHTTPPWVIEHAWHEHGLVTFYQFTINFNDTSEEAWRLQGDAIVSEVESLKETDGIVLWLVGNEMPMWVMEELGKDTVEARLGKLIERVRAVDGTRLISHANWPVTKDLKPPGMDVVCYNVYPAWPYEVAVRGFGPYINNVLAPRAEGKPLLISEFGVNSLEAGEERQAQVLVDCWRDIENGPAVGGVVMEWCDEWWKNYDNPIAGQDYWQREHAPDDADRHDEDPEEYYGMVRADRSAKPAYEAMRQAWGGKARRSWMPFAIVGGIALGAWVLIARVTRRSTDDAPAKKAVGQDEPASAEDLAVCEMA